MTKTVVSPCIGVCRLHPTAGLCEGCYRTLTEVVDWLSMSDQEKRAILADLPMRDFVDWQDGRPIQPTS